ncbi:sugar-binding transcriptional regulator [Jatrophihabitans sp.]|uniref:sugar-binding transcriptional regulator n=1 Tax=Jatrophihabitans sp. TaxID=1932789 RepID=UPI0038CD6D5B
MAVRARLGPAQLVLTASVARRYYIDGKTKIEIADELALSRFKVARLLEDARSSGLVRIEIGHPGEVDVALSADLRDAFHLRHSLVVDTLEEEPAALRGLIGAAAAELLSEIVTAEDVLGLGWARSLISMRSHLRSLAACSVVQLTGALAQPGVDDSSIDLVRDVARIAGGPAYLFYAPMIVPDSAAALLALPEVARAIGRFASVTKAVVGIGGWQPPHSTLYDAISPSDRRTLAEAGVHADVSGVLLDSDGAPVTAALNDRIIGIHAAQLKQIPEVIALAYGIEKATAARAAIRGGYITSLITHTAFARALLAAG